MENEQVLLRELLFSESVKVSEIRKKIGKDADKSLDDLAKRGLVEIKGNVCRLTTEGMRHISYVQGDTVTQVSQPLMCVFPIVHKAGKILLHRRKKQPFYDYVGFPGGKLELGEAISDRLEKELKEETGLTAKKYRLAAMNSIRTLDDSNGRLSAHHVLFFFEVSDFSGKLIEKMEEGENFWCELSKVDGITPIFPDILPIIDAVKKGKPSFFEMMRFRKAGHSESKVLEDYLA